MAPTSQDVARARQHWPDIDSMQLVHGMQLYQQKCGQCHFLYRPQRFSPQTWPRIVDKYAPKAKLTPEEKTLIIRYLVTMSVSDSLR